MKHFRDFISTRRIALKTHIVMHKVKFSKILNMPIFVANQNWNVDRQTLRKLYIILLRPKLDCGQVIFDGMQAVN